VGKRSLHLMGTVNAIIYWRVNKFLKESHIVTRLAKERASFLKIIDIMTFHVLERLTVIINENHHHHHHHRPLIPLCGVGTTCFLVPFSTITRHLHAHSSYFHSISENARNNNINILILWNKHSSTRLRVLPKNEIISIYKTLIKPK
jgi:hypothetical protein